MTPARLTISSEPFTITPSLAFSVRSTPSSVIMVSPERAPPHAQRLVGDRG